MFCILRNTLYYENVVQLAQGRQHKVRQCHKPMTATDSSPGGSLKRGASFCVGSGLWSEAKPQKCSRRYFTLSVSEVPAVDELDSQTSVLSYGAGTSNADAAMQLSPESPKSLSPSSMVSSPDFKPKIYANVQCICNFGSHCECKNINRQAKLAEFFFETQQVSDYLVLSRSRY